MIFKFENMKYKDILDISNLEIEEGKITCITGKSGSGKSTLLKLLNKLISPDSGKIFYKGQDLAQLDSVKYRREVPMLSQFPVIFKGSIRDNLNIGLSFSEKETESDERLRAALSDVGLDKSLDQKANELSGGEEQRLCIARLILMDSESLLLDEPSSSLDPETERYVIEKLASYSKEKGKTLIYVTHSQEMTEEFSDTIIEIGDGKILGRRKNERRCN